MAVDFGAGITCSNRIHGMIRNDDAVAQGSDSQSEWATCQQEVAQSPHDSSSAGGVETEATAIFTDIWV